MIGRKLFVALKDQNFVVRDTTDGYLVLAPDGLQSQSFHKNSIDMSEPVGPSIMANLRSIGFDDRLNGENEREEKKEKPFKCRYCDERFPYARNRGRHESAKHGVVPLTKKPEPKEEELPTPGRVTKRYIEPESPAQRIKNAFKKVDHAMDTIREQGAIIVKESEALYEENKTYKTKIKRMAEQLGKAVDIL